MKQRLKQRTPLSVDAMTEALTCIFSGEAHESDVIDFLKALHARGETVDEVYATYLFLKKKMRPFPFGENTLDSVGTGGDGKNTVNISTASALLMASLGVSVVKHGNRAVSSQSGAADALDALGLSPIEDPLQLKAVFQAHRFSFLYAPFFHPLLKKIKALRKKIGQQTIFHLVAPLLNPSVPTHLMLGVAQKKQLPLLAEVITHTGIDRALIFYGQSVDEMTTLGPVSMMDVGLGAVQERVLDPAAFGFSRARLEALQGGSAQENAEKITACFSGEVSALSETLALNAAVGGMLSGHFIGIEEGLVEVTQALSMGQPMAYLKQLQKHYSELKKGEAHALISVADS